MAEGRLQLALASPAHLDGAAVALEQPRQGLCPSAGFTGGKRGQPSTMSSSSRVLEPDTAPQLGWSGCHSLREESVPSAAHYWHTLHTNCLECTNGSTEEGFIIEVIAVFSRSTFVSGVD